MMLLNYDCNNTKLGRCVCKVDTHLCYVRRCECRSFADIPPFCKVLLLLLLWLFSNLKPGYIPRSLRLKMDKNIASSTLLFSNNAPINIATIKTCTHTRSPKIQMRWGELNGTISNGALKISTMSPHPAAHHRLRDTRFPHASVSSPIFLVQMPDEYMETPRSTPFLLL